MREAPNLTLGIPGDVQQRGIRFALQGVGYKDFETNYEFRVDAESASAIAPLVAFWQSPRDQFSSGVAVGWGESGALQDRVLTAAATSLWAPFTIIAGESSWSLYETIPEVGGPKPLPRLMEADAPYAELAPRIEGRRAQLGADAVAATKSRWRQMALWEADQGESAFMKWAYVPTRRNLAAAMNRTITAATSDFGNDGDLDLGILRWLFRLIGARIAWDKGWMQAGDRASAKDLSHAASRYPTQLGGPISAIQIGVAEHVVEGLYDLNLKSADRGMLSDLVQGSALPEALRSDRRLHCTPPDIAWRMLEGLPIELLRPKPPVVFDGTCGSGTFLVAAKERLLGIDPTLSVDDLINSIRGNDIDPSLTDISRIALDLTTGAALGDRWLMTNLDMSGATPPQDPARPNVIIGNPPFQAAGKGADLALRIALAYVALLERDGLLGLVLPKSAMNAVGWRPLREALRGGNLIEVWDLPSGAFPGVSAETSVVLVEFGSQAPKRRPAVWRTLDQTRTRELIELVAPSSLTPSGPIEPDLAAKIRGVTAANPRLASTLLNSQSGQGITPGRKANEAGVVTREPRMGSVPYLAGRRGMRPFFMPWALHPAWIDLGSPLIHRPRPDHAALLKSPKVLVARHAFWGSRWPVIAAVDELGIYPSDQFLAFAPSPPMSLRLLAGLLNSSFVNCLLSLTSPGYSLRLAEFLAIPLPNDVSGTAARRIEAIVTRLEAIRLERVDEAEALDEAALLAELDGLAFDLYAVPGGVRREIGFHLGRFDALSPRLLVNLARSADSRRGGFASTDARRMSTLFNKRDRSRLTEREAAELSDLVARWQRELSRELAMETVDSSASNRD